MQAEAVQASVQRRLKRLRASCANQRAQRAQLLSILKQLVASNKLQAPSLAYHGSQGLRAGSGSGSDGKQGVEAPSALEHAKRQRAATPAGSSVSAACGGSDSAATGVLEGVSSDVLHIGAEGYPVPSEAVCAMYITLHADVLA